MNKKTQTIAGSVQPIGWPRFVAAPETGTGTIHFGSAEIEWQRNSAKADAKRLGVPYLVYIAVERWMPDGTLTPIASPEYPSPKPPEPHCNMVTRRNLDMANPESEARR